MIGNGTTATADGVFSFRVNQRAAASLSDARFAPSRWAASGTEIPAADRELSPL
jgi:hypothetical protein